MILKVEFQCTAYAMSMRPYSLGNIWLDGLTTYREQKLLYQKAQNQVQTSVSVHCFSVFLQMVFLVFHLFWYFPQQPVKKIITKESHLWDKQVPVEFTPTGWMNEKFLVPHFENHWSLFFYDRYRTHFTAQVIQTCRNHNIILSLISAGTTLITQPLDVAIKKLFKALIKEFTEEARLRKEGEEDIDKWTVGQHRVVTTEAVGWVWEEWHNSVARCKIVIKSFRDTGISLPVDGSCGHELNIEGFPSGELVIGDWARSEVEAGYGLTDRENAVLSFIDLDESVEYRLQDADEWFYISYSLLGLVQASHLLGNGLNISSPYGMLRCT